MCVSRWSHAAFYWRVWSRMHSACVSIRYPSTKNKWMACSLMTFTIKTFVSLLSPYPHLTLWFHKTVPDTITLTFLFTLRLIVSFYRQTGLYIGRLKKAANTRFGFSLWQRNLFVAGLNGQLLIPSFKKKKLRFWMLLFKI